MNKDLKQGDVIEGVQLAPFGEYPNITTDGRKVNQICDRLAFENVVANFKKELIVDFEHASENTEDSSAAGWIESVKVDDVRGLVANIRVSAKGAEALNGLVYRFGSPAFVLDNTDRPLELLSFALTNRPALTDIEKVYNTQPKQDVSKSMSEKILNALGLPADATEEMALESIKGLVDALAAKKAQEEEKKMDEEAEQFVQDLPSEIHDTIKDAFKKDAELVKTVINSVKPQFAKPEETVLNKAEAEKPSLHDELWATYNSLPQNQKTEFALKHKNEMK